MPFLWFGRKKRNEDSQPESRGAAVIGALAAGGLAVTEQELQGLVKRLYGEIEVKLCLPEQMVCSHDAELEATTSKYVLQFSWTRVDGAGNPQGLPDVLARAACYAAVSELAKAKGKYLYVLKPGERVAVCNPRPFASGTPHPLASLLSVL